MSVYAPATAPPQRVTPNDLEVGHRDQRGGLDEVLPRTYAVQVLGRVLAVWHPALERMREVKARDGQTLVGCAIVKDDDHIATRVDFCVLAGDGCALGRGIDALAGATLRCVPRGQARLRNRRGPEPRLPPQHGHAGTRRVAARDVGRAQLARHARCEIPSDGVVPFAEQDDIGHVGPGAAAVFHAADERALRELVLRDVLLPHDDGAGVAVEDGRQPRSKRVLLAGDAFLIAALGGAPARERPDEGEEGDPTQGACWSASPRGQRNGWANAAAAGASPFHR